jgi:hypothetical protein
MFVGQYVNAGKCAVLEEFLFAALPPASLRSPGLPHRLFPVQHHPVLPLARIVVTSPAPTLCIAAGIASLAGPAASPFSQSSTTPSYH